MKANSWEPLEMQLAIQLITKFLLAIGFKFYKKYSCLQNDRACITFIGKSPVQGGISAYNRFSEPSQPSEPFLLTIYFMTLYSWYGR